MASASTLMNDSKSPLNNLALYCDRGLGFLCFRGLGGRFGGLREGNMVTEQGRIKLHNKIVCKLMAKQKNTVKGEVNKVLVRETLSIKLKC